MTTRARLGAHLLSLTMILVAIMLLQDRAEASCALPLKESPHTFTGTVVSVQRDSRIAQVRTEDARNVTVIGAADIESDALTSVDRRYAVGARYEFHPVNSTDPYMDNACTATRKLSGPQPRTSGAADRFPGWLPVDEDAGLLGYAGLGALVLAGSGAVVGVAWSVRWLRRRTAPTEASQS